jgi:senataxin
MTTDPHALSKVYQKMLKDIKQKESKKSDSLNFNYSDNMIKTNSTIDKYFPPIKKEQKKNKSSKKKKKEPKLIDLTKNDFKPKLTYDELFSNNKDTYTKEDYEKELEGAKKLDKFLKKLEKERDLKKNLENMMKNKFRKNIDKKQMNELKKGLKTHDFIDDKKILEEKEKSYLEVLNISKEVLEKNRKELEKEEEAKRKNHRLELLLVGEKKKKFLIPENNKNETEKENNNNSVQNNNTLKVIQSLNAHINPLRKSTNNMKYYKYFKYSQKEIFEKIVDFDFYRNKQFSEEVPNTFESEMHYKYIWVKNFFNELRNTLLSDKAEYSEVENYIRIDTDVNFHYINEADDQISLFQIIPNKRLSDFKKKIFKENDIVAFYPIEEKINFSDINFKNLKKANFFIGIIQLNNDTYDINCYIHNKNCNKFKLIDIIGNSSNNNKEESQLFKAYYLGSLTSSLREYKAILNLELSNFTGILYSKELFTEKENQCGLATKSRLFIDNIKKKKIFNSSQTEAIIKASEMKKKDILLIQGPPGTGKTHTILGLISLFLLNNDGKILICAPSNTAIDEISARIVNKGILNENLLVNNNVNFIRFGLYDRKEKENKYLFTTNGKLIQEYSLENLSDKRYKNRTNDFNSDLELVNKEINECEKNQNKENKQEIEKKLYELKNKRYCILRQLSDLKSERKHFEYELLSNTKILCTTLNSSGSDRLKKMRISFDYLIIDEACQCVEPSALIPLCHNVKQLIMVGDHMQLPATVFSEDASKTLYNRSLFERLIDNNYPRHILTIQYRMHPNIRKFISSIFYNNQLKDDIGLIDRMKKEYIFECIQEKKNFSFFDIAYGKEIFDNKSYFNESEVDFSLKIINQIDKVFKKKIKNYIDNDDDYFNSKMYEKIEKKYKYAVITPYKSQVKLFIEKLNNIKNKLSKNIDIEINTVDSFQGQERDIVIFSTVRSNFLNDDEYNKNHTGIGFLNDFRRMNVALSRAKYACYVIGNSNTLKNNSYWKKLIDYCQLNDTFYKINSINEISEFKRKILNSLERADYNDFEDGEIIDERKKNNNSYNYNFVYKKDNNNQNKILGNKRDRYKNIKK